MTSASDGQRLERQLAELLGLARGVLCDGHVVDREAFALREWIVSNPEVTDAEPGGGLAVRLVLMLEDGVVNDGERSALEALLRDLIATLDGHAPRRSRQQEPASNDDDLPY